MPNRRPHDHLVSKIVSLGVSQIKAESLVSGLSDSQIAKALTEASVLKSIIDIPTKSR